MKPAFKSTAFVEDDQTYHRTILDTTSITPVHLCDPVPHSAVTHMLSRLFEREVIRRAEEEFNDLDEGLPYSVRKMGDLIWCIGYAEYDFDEQGEYAIVMNEKSGALKMVFAYLNEDGSEDNNERYIDPDYIDHVRDYLTRIGEFPVEGVNVHVDRMVIEFKNKKSMFYLICEMIEDEEEFNLVQPEEVALTMPQPLEAEDISPYIRAKHERSCEAANQEDTGLLLFSSPMKPFMSMAHYKAEANMGMETPILNMGQIYEALILEGEKLPYRPECAKAQYYTLGFN